MTAKGIRGPTVERMFLAGRVAGMRAEGLLYREIAQRLGISRSYASALANDPDGSDARARKDSYAGVCIDCGAATTGSNGRASAPQRCQTCATVFDKANKWWTRERVIDAIQRFALEHGRAPTADEWIRANPAHGYPPRSAVYRNAGGNQPFETWADAIEAAGFGHPTTGRRTVMPSRGRQGYVILREDEDGNWVMIGNFEAHSQSIALNMALDGSEPGPGRWVAIPGRYFDPRELRPTTIYEFVQEQ